MKKNVIIFCRVSTDKQSKTAESLGVQEGKIQQDFQEQILKQIKHYSCLDNGDYKRRLYDALNETLILKS